MMPHYVGIAGAARDADFAEQRWSKCCALPMDGEIAAGGLLIPNRAVKLRDILDGLSNTLLVAEASDFGASANGKQRRFDGGYPTGWIAGTAAGGTPPNYDGSFIRPSWNITTIRYPINYRTYPAPGIDENHGPNNPLLSAHRGGVNALLADGSVRFLVDATATLTLKRLATRDDRQPIDLGN
ncbi:MAG: DUF1559 domain-containing protein [Planctomycetaceae bacterium]|nr:DUF1559 domain-containing protein [Planctomycetaceae bacterium]